MSTENIEKEERKDTDTGNPELTADQKVDKLARSLFQISAMHGNAIDTMYIQLITIIEILAEKEIITPESFETKLEEVAKNLEERIKEQNAKSQQGNDKQNPSTTSSGQDAGEGKSKIVTPNSKIIIP